MIRLAASCLVVLVGPSGSGKSTWAAEQFRPSQIVSTDALRALVGDGPHDQRAGKDAFDVLDDVIERRLRRGLLTVVDSLGLDATRRATLRAAAERHSVPCVAVVFDVPAAECRTRNRGRDHAVPPAVLTQQLRAFDEAKLALSQEGFAHVHPPDTVRIVSDEMVTALDAARRQQEDPVPLRFGLQISRFALPGGKEALAESLTDVAGRAERAGFSSIWVMDHMRQIPQVGREWEDMLESWTTLAFLAASTERVRLGTLVTGVTLRNVGHLAKIVATLDVLSRGRAVCGLGAAWFEREHRAYGWPFPPVKERFALLEDALEALPLLWGPGSPSFSGRVIDIPDATSYPRPLQEHVPILVGGGGERRTLRLVAQYADACNLFGGPDDVRRKLEVLARHCEAVGRAADDVLVTHLGTVLVGRDHDEVDRLVDAMRPSRAVPEAFRSSAGAGTVEEHVGRFRELADAGVQTAIVSLADLAAPGAVERFGDVIAAFPSPARDW